MKGNNLYLVLYVLMVTVHFAIWKMTGMEFENIFFRYYLFLSVLFILVLTILSIVRRIYPNYIGFTFMGLIMFKLAMIFLIKNKLALSEVPNYKAHFIAPYLLALVLETLYAVNLLKSIPKDEKNQ